MAYIFKESELPSLVSVVPGRERIFFVNQELASIDDMLAGVMHYKKGAASPLHLHKNCEHFYFIISGKATVESDEGIRAVGPGDLIFIPAEEKHRLRATEPLFYFEFQAPNRFKTTILEGTDDDLRWERKDGRVWVQTRGSTRSSSRGARATKQSSPSLGSLDCFASLAMTIGPVEPKMIML